MHKIVYKDCKRYEAELTKEIDSLKKRFLMPDLLGGRREMLTEIASKQQELSVLQSMMQDSIEDELLGG